MSLNHHNQQSKLVHTDSSAAHYSRPKKWRGSGAMRSSFGFVRSGAWNPASDDWRLYFFKELTELNSLPFNVPKKCEHVEKCMCSLIFLLSSSSFQKEVWWECHVSLCDPILFLSIMTTACSAQPPRTQPRLLPLRRGIKRGKKERGEKKTLHCVAVLTL